jgi:pimeloyl-ACP methyl ester carboxylesterase
MKGSEIISVGGVDLEVQRVGGSGMPILLLHEGLGSVSMWRNFPTRLAAATGRPIIAWSRQGYGASDPLLEARDPDYMHREAAHVLGLMDVLEIPRAHLLGHSDGGSIALITASVAPDRVASLILEAPHVYVEQLTIDSIAGVRAVFEASDLSSRLGRHHVYPDQVFWRWNDIWLDHRFRDWNIEALLPGIDAPALLIQGLDDEYGSMDQLARIEAVLSCTRRLELSQCGHSPHRDQPDEVLAAIVLHLDGIDT